MAIIHSSALLGQPARPQTRGAVHFHRFEHDLAAGFVAAGNVLELGFLPAFSRVSHYLIVPIGLVDAGVTMSMGVLPGVVGSDGARVQGTEFAAAGTALSAAITGVKRDAFELQRSEHERAIGVTFSGDIAAAAGKKIALHLFYHN